MADIVFTNNASSLLAASISTVDTSVQVAAGFGALFPSPGVGEYFYTTLEDNAGNIEIVQCTSRAGDILTVVRAQEGTVAQAFTLTVTRVELRITKATLEEFAQLSGFLMTGDIDLNQNSLLDAYISGPLTRFTQGQIAGVPIRGAVDLTGNEIVVPVNGTSRATAGGALLLAVGDDLMAELDTAGVILFDSATVGLQVPGGAYLRIEGPTAANHIILSHDDTDAAFSFLNTTKVTWDTLLEMSANIEMLDNDLMRVQLIDFAVKKQAVSGISTTVIDYELGSYIVLTLTANIAVLTLDNPPASEVGVFRLKIIQGNGPFTITWPASIKWPGDVEPPLTATDAAVDFVDIWTDDGGVTWYGAFNVDWR